jgi:hypothetical protein
VSLTFPWPVRTSMAESRSMTRLPAGNQSRQQIVTDDDGW